MATDTVERVELRRTFVEDCLSCDCDVGEPVQWKAHTVVLDMNDAQRDELLSRAQYYASPDGPDADGLGGLKASARAILKRFGVLA